MRVEKDVQMPARTVKVLDYIQCDLCGEKSRPDGEWGVDHFDVSEVKVSYREGSSYPEGGHSIEHFLDMCPECFRNKLVPWFEQNGGKVRDEGSYF